MHLLSEHVGKKTFSFELSLKGDKKCSKIRKYPQSSLVYLL